MNGLIWCKIKKEYTETLAITTITTTSQTHAKTWSGTAPAITIKPGLYCSNYNPLAPWVTVQLISANEFVYLSS
ncbi:hypothetical protein LOAG_05206 [Loa loa]|uniref:Uncharacterized protein n=1 Tax=Loa loa TaxID=7209 RepID=A0A1S0U101_LOALO|nr:hypothetical protein LOAG_05206 [Loa loa]EFO23285.2 hypothetical protein LOAG_05206 [Loa loa]